MRIQLVDPSAFTPPYDHALAAALARAGADVALVTSRFLYGPVPSADGYAVTEHFYRRSTRRGLGAPGRVPVKLAEHVPGLLRYRGRAALAAGRRLPPERAAVETPVAMFFGRLRPYKGLDVLLEAWRAIEADAELWIVGMPRMDLEPLRSAADARVRFVPRFVGDPEIPAFFRRAVVVELTYRELDLSGVLIS